MRDFSLTHFQTKARLKPHIRKSKPVIPTKAGIRWVSSFYLKLLSNTEIHRGITEFFYCIYRRLALSLRSPTICLSQPTNVGLHSVHHQPTLLISLILISGSYFVTHCRRVGLPTNLILFNYRGFVNTVDA